jgi:carboxypeptidase C (cathepsin A)
MPIWDEDGRPIAGVFYTYYEREDVTDRATRPLVISFNGGPGTPSVWMELGYTGPRVVNVDSEGYPIQPYGVSENKNSILDVADIVYLDPVNTGYSRIVDKESYGTTRASGLALELQSAQDMYLNGVILVSPTDLGINRSGPVKAALKLPYFAATAWYHGALAPEFQKKELTAYLPEVEDFTINQLIPALAKGGYLDDAQRKDIAAKIAKYSGISEKVVMENNLDVSYDLFWKELLRDKGFTVGRLDSRYKGIDRQAGGTSPDYNAELTSWLHAFTPAMNIYMRDELNYKTDLHYNMFGNVWPWDDKDDQTGENLRAAIAQNPYLHLMIQSGYYDGACDYFNAKYSLWQLDPSGRLKDRLKWEGYKSGHMMYLRKDDLTTATESLRNFIKESVPKPGTPAKY